MGGCGVRFLRFGVGGLASGKKSLGPALAGKTGYGGRFASGAEVVFETGLAGAVFDGFGDGKKAPGPAETFDDGGGGKGRRDG